MYKTLERLYISFCGLVSILHRTERKMRQTFYKKIKNYN